MGSKRRRWASGVASVLAVATACGGSTGQVDDPMALPTTTVMAGAATATPASTAAISTSVPRLQPGDRPLVFVKDDRVSETIQAFIVETLRWAHRDLGDSGPLTVQVFSDEASYSTAYAAAMRVTLDEARQRVAAGVKASAVSSGNIWLYLPNFLKGPDAFRRLALFHEYIHTLQFWHSRSNLASGARRGPPFVPRWIMEGCAEYLTVTATAMTRFVNQSAVRDRNIASTRDSVQSLEALETGGAAFSLGGDGQAYTVGWVGCERLANGSSEEAVASGFWLSLAKLQDWQAAFTDAFGMTPAAFYADFAAWRATL